MYFYNYGPLNPSLMPNKDTFLVTVSVSKKVFHYIFWGGGEKNVWKAYGMSEMVNICLRSCLSPALLLPKSGNTSFPGETKLLLYHSGPQVFHCSPTVSCKQWCGEGGWRREHLPMPISHRHTQMLFVMPVHFQKAAGCPITDCVPNWHATAVCTDSSTGRHNETLFVFFFFIYWITTSFHHCSCVVWSRRCQQRSSEG